MAEMKGRLFKNCYKVGVTRINAWKYQEFKSMPHYERLHVCEASIETALSLIRYGGNK
jgi:hypothetical protein